MLPTQSTAPDTRVEVTILVNEHQVRITGPKATGLQIKEAAIAQGVKIALDFVLSLELGNRKARVVRDEETVTLHHDEQFVANPPDDNS